MSFCFIFDACEKYSKQGEMKFQPLIIVVGLIYEASKGFRELNCLSIPLYFRNETRLEILLIIAWFSASASRTCPKNFQKFNLVHILNSIIKGEKSKKVLRFVGTLRASTINAWTLMKNDANREKNYKNMYVVQD